MKRELFDIVVSMRRLLSLSVLRQQINLMWILKVLKVILSWVSGRPKDVKGDSFIHSFDHGPAHLSLMQLNRMNRDTFRSYGLIAYSLILTMLQLCNSLEYP
jgi:hypothetical protein